MEVNTMSRADRFAHALDLCGWKIVRQDGSRRRWRMNEPSDNCPVWALHRRTRRPRMTVQEHREQEAMDLICSAAADDFARALDLLGWKIVRQDEVRGGVVHLWPMNGTPGYCPQWADPDVPSAKPQKPTLHVIDGGTTLH
jgi:hypothetical protein